MLFNPNRLIENTDDIYGIRRVNMVDNIQLPGVHSFYATPSELPITGMDCWATRFTKDNSRPDIWNPDTSTSVVD